jgi:hypothetical protein
MAEMENALEAATVTLDSAITNATAVDDDVGAQPAITKLAAAVRAFDIRRLKSRHLAAAQAVSRSLSGVDEVFVEEDADSVADLYNQLDKRGQELTAAAADLGDQQVIEDEGLLALVDKSLRKLAKRRRELARGAADGGPPPSMPDDGSGGGRCEAQPLQAEVPPAHSGGGGNVSLTADQLKDILAALAAGGGKPKLPVPPWPTFLDTFRSFFLF